MDGPAYVRSVMRPLLPEPTGIEPRLDFDGMIRAVIFDIYGTLLISGAGDISLVKKDKDLAGMQQVIRELGDQVRCADANRWCERYHEGIEQRRDEAFSHGVSFPEIEVREVWSDLMAELGIESAPASLIERCALVYECRVNPTWEMPGASDLLSRLRSMNLPLGIISNAQFYTHSVFEAALGIKTTDFESRLCVYSYEERLGKPSLNLYEKMREELEGSIGLAPDDVLYVGNDLIKDVIPAKEVGFRTALFAGDGRSLRFGEVDQEEGIALADLVVTDLAQILQVIDRE